MEIDGKPLLHHHLMRLKRAKAIDHIVVATTVNETDNQVVEYCKSIGIETFRGDEHNVLSRYAECAQKHDAASIIRVTSDCPLIDPILIDQTVLQFSKENRDLIFTDKTDIPSGFDIEIFTHAALDKAYQEAFSDYDLEHVTPYIRNNPGLFNVAPIKISKITFPETLHLSVDTEDDFKRIRSIIDSVGTDIVMEMNWKEVVQYYLD